MKSYGRDLLESWRDLDTEGEGPASGRVFQQIPISSSPAARLSSTAPRLADAASGPGPAA